MKHLKLVALATLAVPTISQARVDSATTFTNVQKKADQLVDLSVIGANGTVESEVAGRDIKDKDYTLGLEAVANLPANLRLNASYLTNKVEADPLASGDGFVESRTDLETMNVNLAYDLDLGQGTLALGLGAEKTKVKEEADTKFGGLIAERFRERVEFNQPSLAVAYTQDKVGVGLEYKQNDKDFVDGFYSYVPAETTLFATLNATDQLKFGLAVTNSDYTDLEGNDDINDVTAVELAAEFQMNQLTFEGNLARAESSGNGIDSEGYLVGAYAGYEIQGQNLELGLRVDYSTVTVDADGSETDFDGLNTGVELTYSI